MTAPTPNAPTGERTFRTRECMQCGGTMFWGFTAAVDGLPCWTCIYCMSAALLAARREVEATRDLAAQAADALDKFWPDTPVQSRLRYVAFDLVQKIRAALAATPEEKND